LSSRKRNRLAESPGISSSMTIRSTEILPLALMAVSPYA
jgi:hypothetical protein